MANSVTHIGKDSGLVAGRLTAHFAAIDMAGLRQSVLSRLDVDARKMAEQTLSDFERAARTLDTAEHAFNSRAVRQSGGLTQNLRDGHGLKALRSFNAAVERVEDVPHGTTLVRKMRRAAARI
jgi:hypothetical protein